MKRDPAFLGRMASVSLAAFAHRFVPFPWNVSPEEATQHAAAAERSSYKNRRHKTWRRSPRGDAKRARRAVANEKERERQRSAAEGKAELHNQHRTFFYSNYGSLQREIA